MTCSAQAAAEIELEATGLEIEDGIEETVSPSSQRDSSLSGGSISGSRFRFLLSLALCNCCFREDRAV